MQSENISNQEELYSEEKQLKYFIWGTTFDIQFMKNERRKGENKVFSCQGNFSDVMNYLSDLILSFFLHISSSYVAFITKLIIILSCCGHKTLFGS